MHDLELAKATLAANSLAFVIVKDGRILRTGTQEGIAELIQAVEELAGSTVSASLADKIVGKAVAMVARYAGIRAVYSPLASIAARQALAEGHILLESDQMVPLILNKRNDGPCPMERLTLPITDPSAALAALRDWASSHRPPP